MFSQGNDMTEVMLPDSIFLTSELTEGNSAAKEGSYPKPYYLLGANSKWPFASTNGFDGYKNSTGKLRKHGPGEGPTSLELSG